MIHKFLSILEARIGSDIENLLLDKILSFIAASSTPFIPIERPFSSIKPTIIAGNTGFIENYHRQGYDTVILTVSRSHLAIGKDTSSTSALQIPVGMMTHTMLVPESLNVYSIICRLQRKCLTLCPYIHVGVGRAFSYRRAFRPISVSVFQSLQPAALATTKTASQ